MGQLWLQMYLNYIIIISYFRITYLGHWAGIERYVISSRIDDGPKAFNLFFISYMIVIQVALIQTLYYTALHNLSILKIKKKVDILPQMLMFSPSTAEGRYFEPIICSLFFDSW